MWKIKKNSFTHQNRIFTTNDFSRERIIDDIYYKSNIIIRVIMLRITSVIEGYRPRGIGALLALFQSEVSS